MARKHTKQGSDKRRKLSPSQVRYIRANPQGMTFEQLGRECGVEKLAAFQCYHGITYKHIK